MLDKDRMAKDKADILSIKTQIEEIVAMDKKAFMLDKRNLLFRLPIFNLGIL